MKATETQNELIIQAILIQVVSLVMLWLTFTGLQSPSVYHNSLGLISKNWTNQNGERKLVANPYIQVTNENYVGWDGDHYQQIKNYGYNLEKANGDYIYAFFPLFPLIWKISNLQPLGVLFMNYIFFSIAILLLLSLSERKSYIFNTVLSLSLPGVIIFLIPYTEATFMFFISLGIYGIINKKYWIYFIAFLLASLTRPTFTFIGLSILAVELLFLISHKSFNTAIRNFLLRVAPLIAGTFLVPLIQGSGSLFKFIEVQKYWENAFLIPDKLSDWSQEGFGINMAVVFLIFIPLLYLLAKWFFALIRKSERFGLNYEKPQDYLALLSAIYLLGMTLYVLLFRGGSLHCLFRFTICSPFIFILLFSAFEFIGRVPFQKRLKIVFISGFFGFSIFFLAEYSRFISFSDLGFFILAAVIGIWLFQDRLSSRLKKTSLITLLLVNIIWTTYLFNMYISNGWIFA